MHGIKQSIHGSEKVLMCVNQLAIISPSPKQAQNRSSVQIHSFKLEKSVNPSFTNGIEVGSNVVSLENKRCTFKNLNKGDAKGL